MSVLEWVPTGITTIVGAFVIWNVLRTRNRDKKIDNNQTINSAVNPINEKLNEMEDKFDSRLRCVESKLSFIEGKLSNLGQTSVAELTQKQAERDRERLSKP